MGLFQESEGDTAILSENGVYKQVPIYTRDGYLYGKVGSGFIRLNVDGSTTKPTCRLDHLDIVSSLGRDNMGRLCLAVKPGAKPLPSNTAQLLLGTTEKEEA